MNGKKRMVRRRELLSTLLPNTNSYLSIYETTNFLNRLNKIVLGTATVIFSGAAAKLLDTKK